MKKYLLALLIIGNTVSSYGTPEKPFIIQSTEKRYCTLIIKNIQKKPKTTISGVALVVLGMNGLYKTYIETNKYIDYMSKPSTIEDTMDSTTGYLINPYNIIIHGLCNLVCTATGTYLLQTLLDDVPQK